MFPRKTQQSAASGVVRLEPNPGSGFNVGGSPASTASRGFDNTDHWNSDRDDTPVRRFQQFNSMPQEDFYYNLLLRAVAGLDGDSYAARGAAYDREYRALMRKLYSANPPHSDAEIDAVKRAYRNAVRRVEFGLSEEQEEIVTQRREIEEPQHAPRDYAQGYREEPRPAPAPFDVAQEAPDDIRAAPAPVAPSPPPPTPASRAARDRSWERPPVEQRPSVEPRPPFEPRPPLREPPSWSIRQGAEPAAPSERIESALEMALNLRAPPPLRDEQDDAPEPEPEPEIDDPVPQLIKRKSIVGRVLARVALAVVLLGVGIAGYHFFAGDSVWPWLDKVAENSLTESSLTESSLVSPAPINPAPQQVILFDGARPDFNGSKFDGKAYWRVRNETSGAKALPAIQLDLDVPGRKVFLTMTMRREPAGSSMSHLFEIRFIGPDRKPDPDISNIAGIVMTSADMTKPMSLTGQVVNVTPGVFMFGLSALASDQEQNLRKLIDSPWIGIPLSYRNGATGVLTFEKGAEGDKVFNEVFRRWAGTP
jgi:hypothetical protein